MPLGRNRDFALLWSGAACSQFGSMLSLTAYPLLALALSHSAAWAGLVGTANQLPFFFLQMPAGVFVDRWNRKTVMIVCDAARACVLALLALAALGGFARVWMLVPTALLEGCFTVFYRLAESGAIRNIVPREQYPAAVARNQARTFGAAMLSRSAAGFLYAVSRALPFGVDSLSYVVSLGATSLTRGQFQLDRSKSTRRPALREAGEGLAWIWQRPYIRALTLMVPAATLLLQALPLLVILIASSRRTASGEIGLMLLGFSIGGLTGALSAGWVRGHLSLRAVTLGGPWLWCAACAAIALFPYAAVIIAATALVGSANAAWNVVVGAYQMAQVPDRLIGRVGSATQLLGTGAAACGPVLLGSLTARVGADTAMWVLAIGAALLALASTGSPVLRHPPRSPLPGDPLDS